LTLSRDEVEKEIKSMEKQSKAIKEEALRLSWHMRGGLSYNDALMLSNNERMIINKIIEGNMKTTKETKLPFF
jgi:hypothetical protein